MNLKIPEEDSEAAQKEVPEPGVVIVAVREEVLLEEVSEGQEIPAAEVIQEVLTIVEEDFLEDNLFSVL